MRAGTHRIEGEGWWGEGDDSEATLYHAECVELNEVMIEAASTGGYLDDETRRAHCVKLNVAAADALAFAKQVEAAAYEALASVGEPE